MFSLFAILSTLATFVFIVYYATTLRFNHWKNKKVPYLTPLPILGNYEDYILLRKTIGEAAKNICEKFKGVPYFGAFYGTEPVLLVQDPELLKLIMTKDFYYFSEREVSKYTHKEVFTKNIFFSGGDRWRVVRQNLTPIFTSARMKSMFYLIEKCSYDLETMLEVQMKINDQLEVRSVMARYMMECIGSCAFGVDTHTMDLSCKENPFEIIGTGIFQGSVYRGFKNIVRAIWPSIFYTFGFKSFPTQMDKFFSDLLIAVFQERGNKPSARNDFVDHMLAFKESNYLIGDDLSNMKTGDTKKVKLRVDNELLVAQCITFFAAGFETSATTSSYTLYELAKNQEAQKRVHEEVDDFLQRHNNRITYDCMKELPFLDACIYEALRKYPVLGILTREVVEDYSLPSGLRLEKGSRIHIPVYHMHNDSANFPEPEQFKPERFLPENKNLIKPYTFFPFGEGHRICIGLRFARMQMLAGLVTFLKRYRVELAPGMPSTMTLDPRSFVNIPMGGIYLKCQQREGWEQRQLTKVNT